MNLDSIIFDLKKEYDDIFISEIMGEVFIFRPLTKYEFDQFMRSENMSDNYKAEKICELCVLYPEKYDFFDPSYAGVPETLMEKIIGHSGFSDKDFVLEVVSQYRKANDKDPDRKIENMILSVFDQFTVEDIKSWNIYKILDYYSRAEWIINNVRNDYNNPNNDQGQGQQQQQGNNPQRMQQKMQQQPMTKNQMGMGQNMMNRRG